MKHPYAPLTRRDPRPAPRPQPLSDGMLIGGLVGWTVAAGFSFIIIYGFVLPILRHFGWGGQ